MKRTAGESPPKHPRQDPVSCDSCRRKKIKCDRQQPCSSCVARRLSCSFVKGEPPTQSQRGGTEYRSPSKRFAVNAQSNAYQPPPPSVIASPAGHNSHAVVDHPSHSHESLVTADWLEHIHMADRVPAALSPQMRAGLGEPNHGTSTINPNLPRILLSTMRAGGRTWTPNENPATLNLTSYLPRKTEVLSLFKYYCNYIDYLYHIIIPQHVEEHIHEIYRCVETDTPAKLDHLALLFAIAGASLYFQLSIESAADAEMCIQQFSFLTGAALMQGNYTTYPSIEGLQAALVILHHVSNVHCHVAAGGLFTAGSVIHQAKTLLLHRTDTPASRGESPFSLVELELRRRLWWDIASFDWLLGFLSGPQEWTYLINPQFMHVHKPSNIDDSTLLTLTTPTHSPPSTPTDMTFFLERLKLAETCRAIVDAISPSPASPETETSTSASTPYTTILSLDAALHTTQSQTPPCLRLDPSSRRRFAKLYTSRPTLAWQRLLLQQAYYSRLCRLHRPFFIRGAKDPKYSYSHVIGLSSARKVLEIKRIMDEEEPVFVPSSSAIWSIMHHVFMAAVMLLLDVCYNWDEILAEKRREEVLAAVRMLSRAQRASSVVREGIEAMMGVLRRHYCGRNELADGNETESGNVNVNNPNGNGSGSGSWNGSGELEREEDGVPPDGGDGLEDLWCEILDSGGNLDLESEDWASLFTELNNAGMPAN